MREEEQMRGVASRGALQQPQVTSGGDGETDHLIYPYDSVRDDLEEVLVHDLGNEPGEERARSLRRHRSSRKSIRASLLRQTGNEPGASAGNAGVLPTIKALKDLLKQERLLRRCYGGKTSDPIFRAFIELLDTLEEEAEDTSAPFSKNLDLKGKVKMLTSQWSKLPPLESNHLRSVLFVLLSQLNRAATSTRPPEDGAATQRNSQEVIRKLLAFLNTTRCNLEEVLYLQRDISNEIWRLNHVYKVSKRRGLDSELSASLDGLSLDLMQLSSCLLSAVIEHWIVLRPTLEYYAENFGPATSASERNSTTSTLRGSGAAKVPLEAYASLSVEVCESLLRNYARKCEGLKMLQMALSEMKLEGEEWGDVTGSRAQNGGPESSQTREFREVDGTVYFDLAAGDATAEEIAEDTAGDSVDDILDEALYITSCILTGTNEEVTRLDRQIENRSCSLFRMEYLDDEKFRGKIDHKRVRTVNSLISLNYTLSLFKLSVEELVEESVAMGRPDGLAPLVSMDSDPGDEDVLYFSNLPFEGPGVTKDSDGIVLPAAGVISKGIGLRISGLEDDEIATYRGGDRPFVGKFGDKMSMFQRKLVRKIGIVMDREGFRDDKLMPVDRKWLRLENMLKAAWSLSQSRREFWERVIPDVQGFERRLRDAYGPGGRSPLPIDCLLFDTEREALRELARSQEHSILENLDRVTQTLKGNKREGVMGQKYLRGFPSPPEDGKLPPLEEAAISLRKSNMPREKLKARKIDVLLLVVFPVLYLADVVSDIYMASRHFSMGNFLYFGLTILFILGPMVAEVISKLSVKLKGYEDDLPWKRVFYIEILRLLPRAGKSLRYALDSRREFDNDLTTFYSVLNRLRGGVYVGSGALVLHSEAHHRQSTWGPGFDARFRPDMVRHLIQAHSYANMITNEKLLFHWKMVDCLNESAPQLLLQLVILNVQLVAGEEVGHWSVLGIVVSLACFSWTLHLCHYYMHYDGLKNNFKISDRATDFLAHFLIVGGRFAAISFVAALHPIFFLGVCSLYLTGRCIYLYNFSSTRWAYKLITKNYMTVLWPVHRLFITPYILRIWRCDVFDDVIYHVETFVLALSWAYLLDGGHPLGHLRWAVTAAILVANFVLLPLILKYNNARHDPSRFCKEDDPFWLGKYLDMAQLQIQD